MAVHIRGKYRDLWAFIRQPLDRARRIRRASADFLPPDQLQTLTTALHPRRLELTVQQVRSETPLARTYRLVPAGQITGQASNQAGQSLPPFRSGQYLSLEFRIRGVRVSRPYSICCSPGESAQGNYYEITVAGCENGFVAPHIWEQWRPGSRVYSSGPLGQFGYEPLRDHDHLVFLAGGCGITPFRSLWRQIRTGEPSLRCTILYGAASPAEFIFREELEQLAAEMPARFQVHLIAEEADPQWHGLRGLITGKRIRELAGEPGDKTYMLCGPPGMHRFVERELAALDLPAGSLRKEPCGESEEVFLSLDYPAAARDLSYTLLVHQGESTRTIAARGSETVLVALERAGLAPPAQCRSGQCGYCRSQLLAGRVYVRPETDGRRQADRKFGYFHPCSSYALSDLEICVPVNPLPPLPEPEAAEGSPEEALRSTGASPSTEVPPSAQAPSSRPAGGPTKK